MVPVKTMFSFRNGQNSKSSAPCIDSYGINVLSCADFLRGKNLWIYIYIYIYIYISSTKNHAFFEKNHAFFILRNATCIKIFKTWSYRQNYKSHQYMLLVAVSLLVDGKTNSLLFFPSNMASNMSLQTICSPFR